MAGGATANGAAGAAGGGGQDFSQQWIQYYRSQGMHAEADKIEAQMKATKVGLVTLRRTLLAVLECLSFCLIFERACDKKGCTLTPSYILYLLSAVLVSFKKLTCSFQQKVTFC